LRRHDGEYHWWLIRGVPVLGDKGEILKWFGTCTDIEEMKKAAEAVRRSEEYFRNIFEHSTIGISITSLNGKLRTNKEFCRILGYSTEELAVKNWKDITHPDHVELNQKNLETIISGEKSSMRWEKRYIHKNGNIVWVDISTVLQRDEENKPLYFITTIQDITERINAAESLQESEERYRNLITNLEAGIVVHAPNTSILMCNQRASELLGLSEDQMKGKIANDPYWHFVNENNIPLKLEDYPVNQIIASHQPLKNIVLGVVHSKTQDTIWLTVNGFSVFDPNGELEEVLVSFIDITKRKQAEAKEVLAYNRLRKFIDSNIIGVVIASPNGAIIETNDYYLNLIGYSREEFELGLVDWKTITPPEWLPADEKAILELREKETCAPYEKEYQLRNGERISVLLADALLPGPEEQIAAFVLDNTDRKRTEKEIQRLNETLENRVIERTAQLDAVNKELESFSYSVSHDLRAPLRHISGFADMLSKEINDSNSEKAQRYLNTIGDSARKMGILIDDLLSFSRTGRAELKKTTISMNQVIEDVLKQVKTSVSERIVNWEISTLPEVYGDYNLLYLVWVNLIDNALKYTRKQVNAVIQINCRKENEEYIFSISDNGAGFDMKYAQKLFGVFQRLHSSAEFEGTGIGLANVRRIILRHGGRTWAEAELGKGATFYFSLPG
jgi:PAS domain S-box-containing protein